MMPAHYAWQPTLAELLEGLVPVEAVPSMTPSSLSMDSRLAAPGSLFLACAGLSVHGMVFARIAVDQGARVVLAEPAGEWGEREIMMAASELRVPVIPVWQLSKKAGQIAGRFYGDPTADMDVIGITGTNGKTSVSHFLAQALGGERRCGIIGTLGYGLPGAMHEATHTTPDAVRLQGELASMRDEGADCVAMEVSSHALHQSRVGGVRFHTAVFTNLSRDHLDYHGDMDSYGKVKAGLFQRAGLQLAVINVDDDFGRELVGRVTEDVRVIACGTTNDLPAGADSVRALNVRTTHDGLQFDLQIADAQVAVSSALLGRFNIDNLLLVAGVLHGWGMSPESIAQRLAMLKTVPGRMEDFTAPGMPRVVVDYAHTPDALEKALKALRPHCEGKLHCVFGCGGERDSGKRPLMGEVAERLADSVVITDDNPRGEEGADIIEHILAGMSRPGEVQIQRNRDRAIAGCIAAAAANDIVLVAGKGHEDYQLVGNLKLPFSDAEHVQRALGLGGEV